MFHVQLQKVEAVVIIIVTDYRKPRIFRQAVGINGNQPRQFQRKQRDDFCLLIAIIFMKRKEREISVGSDLVMKCRREFGVGSDTPIIFEAPVRKVAAA